MNWIRILGRHVLLVLSLLISACSSNSGGQDAGASDGDAGGLDPGQDAGDPGQDTPDPGDYPDHADQGKEGDPGPVGIGCNFPFGPPEKHIIKNEMGLDQEVYNLQTLCTLSYGDLNALVFMIAEPTGEVTGFDFWYKAKEAFLCRDGEVTQLPSDPEHIFYQAGHHGYDEMRVVVEGKQYVYGWSEMCFGARPCIDAFDIFDVRSPPPENTLIAGNQPAICTLLTQQGKPKPLVPSVRIPTEGLGPIGDDELETLVYPMGSSDGDSDEQPIHDVTFQYEAMRMDQREATNRDFTMFLNDRGNQCQGQPCMLEDAAGVKIRKVNDLWEVEPGYEDHPAVQISWYGAQEYCQWRGWRSLPTEAQWELAASAEGTRQFPWGNDPPTCERAMFAECQATGPEAVCSRPTGNSREQICDLGGNVAEWISDWYTSDYYSNCQNECLNPRGPTQETGQKVIRGGGFDDPATKLRAADRNAADPGSAFPNTGVRCVSRAGSLNPWRE